MPRLVLTSFFLFALLPCCAADAPATPVAATPWQLEGSGDRIVIYSRTREGSPVKEFKSVGEINAPAHAVFAVLDDTEAYPSFMPYSSETKVIKRTADTTVAYQRLVLPLVSDRDYTLLSEHTTKEGPNGVIYTIRWHPANDLGPAEKPGVERVKVCEGAWVIEPDGKGHTLATYRVYTDSGGSIPAIIANSGSRTAIRKVFAAIRKEVHDPKYAEPKG